MKAPKNLEPILMESSLDGREISQERLTISRIAIKPEKRYGWVFMRWVMGGNPGTGFFPARYDEVRFWNRAMTDEEIRRKMSLAVSPLEKVPLMWGGIKTRHVKGY